jgi:hypothetical protein
LVPSDPPTCVEDEGAAALLVLVEALDVVMELLGLIATTIAGSVATAAVDAAFTAAVLVPSVSF